MVTVVLLEAVCDLLIGRELLGTAESRAENFGRSTAAVQIAVAFSLTSVAVLEALEHIARVEGLVLEVALGVVAVVETRALKAVDWNRKISGMQLELISNRG